MREIYNLAFYRCHQFPHRSLFWGGMQFPVCVRDTGITMGFLAGILAIYLAKNHRSKNVDPRMLLLLVPMAIDGVFQLLGVWQSIFVSRFLSGLLSGFAIAIVFVSLLQREKGEMVPNRKSVMYFGIVSVPLFIGYWMIELGYNIGVAGEILFWLIVWSVPFIYFVMGIAVIAVGLILFRKITDEMGELLDRD